MGCERNDLETDGGGTEPAAVLYRIMASAKANQVKPFAYVRDLLSQLSGYSPPEVAMPLPDAWLAAQRTFPVPNPSGTRRLPRPAEQ